MGQSPVARSAGGQPPAPAPLQQGPPRAQEGPQRARWRLVLALVCRRSVARWRWVRGRRSARDGHRAVARVSACPLPTVASRLAPTRQRCGTAERLGPASTGFPSQPTAFRSRKRGASRAHARNCAEGRDGSSVALWRCQAVADTPHRWFRGRSCRAHLCAASVKGCHGRRVRKPALRFAGLAVAETQTARRRAGSSLALGCSMPACSSIHASARVCHMRSRSSGRRR